jgi:transcriptional regulator with XRE-family HTH domain
MDLVQQSGGIPRRKLTAEKVKRAEQLTALGLPMLSIAQALGVNRCTLRQWIAAGLEPDASPLEAALTAAIQRGRVEGEEQLVKHLHKLAKAGDTRAATWLLSHSPRWRDTWSDASHARREVQRTVQLFVEALEQDSSLRPEQRERVLLAVRAKGLALAAGDSGEQE